MEVSVIGTGGGYGESIILRWDGGNSAVIDSCVDPLTKECLPLKYLRKEGADLEKVQFIVATHWHDDHVQGISTILEHCPKAVFWTTAAKSWSIFFRLIAADKKNLATLGASNLDTAQRALSELDACMEILERRGGSSPLRAQGDHLIYRGQGADSGVEMFALSPSDFAIEGYEQELASHIDEIGKFRIRVPRVDANDKSVALFVSYKGQRLILGADLEIGSITPNGSTGWHDVVKGMQCMGKEGGVRVLKVPHHASKGAQHPKLWSDLVSADVVSLITPWHKSVTNYVPDAGELNHVRDRSARAFITSMHGNIGKPKPRDSDTKKLMSKVGLKMKEIKYSYGLIRVKFDEHTAAWKHEIQGTASEVL